MKKICSAIVVIGMLIIASIPVQLSVIDYVGGDSGVGANPSITFKLSCDEPAKDVGKEDVVKIGNIEFTYAIIYKIKVTTWEAQTLEFSVSQPEGWYVYLVVNGVPKLFPYYVSMHFGVGTREVEMIVKVPEWMIENSCGYVKLIGESTKYKYDEQYEKHSALTVTTMNSYKAWFTGFKLKQYIIPGHSVLYDTVVKNCGKASDTIEFVVKPPNGWNVLFYWDKDDDSVIDNNEPTLFNSNPAQDNSVDTASVSTRLPPFSVTDDLLPRASLNLLIKVDAPDYAPKYFEANIEIKAQSRGAYSKAGYDTRIDDTSITIKSIVAGMLVSISDEDTANKYYNGKFRGHNVNVGMSTSFVINVFRLDKNQKTVSFTVSATCVPPDGWSISLDEWVVDLGTTNVGDFVSVHLTVSPSFDRQPGDRAKIKVEGTDNIGKKDSVEVTAKVSLSKKVYIINIDGMGAEWFDYSPTDTKNLIKLKNKGSYYSNATSILPAQTDMNQVGLIASAHAGTTGMLSVGATYKGLDNIGYPIIEAYTHEDVQVMTIYGMIKSADFDLRTGVIAGKNWVANIFTSEWTDIKAQGYEHPIYVDDPPEYILGRIMPVKYGMPMNPRDFPGDEWVIESTKKIIEYEDPDFMYIHMANMDDAGHLYGCAYDDPSKYNPEANWGNMVWQMATTDAAVGNFLDFLDKINRFYNSIVVVTSDHGMSTMYISEDKLFDIREILEKEGFVMGAEYDYDWAGGIGPWAGVYNFRNKADIAVAKSKLEKYDAVWKVLNEMDMKYGINPVTGRPYKIWNEASATGAPAARGQKMPELAVLLEPHYQVPMYADVLKGGMNAFAFKFQFTPEFTPVEARLVGHHGTYSEQHIPLILHGPGIQRGYSSDEPVEILDIIPTITELNNRWANPPSTEGIALDALSDWSFFHHDVRHPGFSPSKTPNNDNLAWSKYLGAPVSSSPAVVNGTVYVGTNNGGIYALNAKAYSVPWMPDIERGAEFRMPKMITVPGGEEIWSYQDPDYGKISSPAVADGMVFFSTSKGKLYAFDIDGLADGDQKSSDLEMYSLPKEMGEYKWGYGKDKASISTKPPTSDIIWTWNGAGGSALSPPVVEDGIVYVSAANGELYAIHTAGALKGQTAWHESLGVSENSTPAVVNGIVYVGTTDGRMLAFKHKSILEENPWMKEFFKVKIGSPTMLEERFIEFGKYVGKTYYGWEYKTGGAINTAPAVTHDKVFFGSDDGNVYALNRFTGEKIWVYYTGVPTVPTAPVRSSPAVHGDYVYVGNDAGKFFILDVKTGNVKQTLTGFGAIKSSPAISSDNKIFFGSDNNNFYCRGASSWSYTTGGSIVSSPAIAYDMVYVGSNDCYIYAFGKIELSLVIQYSIDTSIIDRLESPVVVSNYGSVADNFYLEVSELPIGWNYEIVPNMVYLEPGESKEVTLIITLPKDVPAGIEQEIDIISTASYGSTIAKTLSIVTTSSTNKIFYEGIEYSELSLEFSRAGDKLAYIKLPKEADVSEARMEIEGKILISPGYRIDTTTEDFLTGELINLTVSDGNLFIPPLYVGTGVYTSSTTIETSNILSVSVSWVATLNGQKIIVYVSNDDGYNWFLVDKDVTFYFPTTGNKLRYTVLFITADPTKSPILHEITLTYNMKVKETTDEDFSKGKLWNTIASGGNLYLNIQSPHLTGLTWKPDGSYALIYGSNGFVCKFDGTNFEQIITEENFPFVSGDWKGKREDAVIIASYGKVDGINWGGRIYRINESFVSSPITITLPSIYGGLLEFIRLRGDGLTGIIGGAYQKYSWGNWHGVLYEYDGGVSLKHDVPYDRALFDADWYPDDSAFILSKYWDGRLFIYKYDKYGNLVQIYIGPKTGFPHIAIRPQADYALITGTVTGGGVGGIYKYDITKNSLTQTYTSTVDWRDIAWHPSGSFALIVGSGGNIIRYDASTGKLTNIPSGITTSFNGLAWKPDGSYALIAGDNGELFKFVVVPWGWYLTSYKVYTTVGTYASRTITTTLDIESATLDWDAYLYGSGQKIDVYASNNDGLNWYKVYDGISFKFPTVGNKLKYRAIFSTTYPPVAPILHEIILSFSPKRIDTTDTEFLKGTLIDVVVSEGNITLKPAFALTGTYISSTTITPGDIIGITATWLATLNNQTIDVYVSNNNGTNWYKVENNTMFSFPTKFNQLKYKVVLSTTDPSISPIFHEISLEYIMESYPMNPSIDVGNDGIKEWSYTGIFDAAQTLPNFSDSLNNYIARTLPDEEGNVWIPINIHTDKPGILKISKIFINYTMKRADLIPLEIELPYEYLTIDKQVRVAAKIANKGNYDAYSIDVKFLDNGIEFYTDKIFRVSPNSEAYAIAKFIPYYSGAHNITVIVDPDNKIIELSELNNEIRKDVIVGDIVTDSIDIKTIVNYENLILVTKELTVIAGGALTLKNSTILLDGITKLNVSYNGALYLLNTTVASVGVTSSEISGYVQMDCANSLLFGSLDMIGGKSKISESNYVFVGEANIHQHNSMFKADNSELTFDGNMNLADSGSITVTDSKITTGSSNIQYSSEFNLINSKMSSEGDISISTNSNMKLMISELSSLAPMNIKADGIIRSDSSFIGLTAPLTIFGGSGGKLILKHSLLASSYDIIVQPEGMMELKNSVVMTNGKFIVEFGGLVSSADSMTWAINRMLVSPIADAGPDRIVTEDEIVYFDASGSTDIDGIIVSYEWNFGDGTFDVGIKTFHSYPKQGIYTITLTAIDNDGAIGKDTVLVLVKNVPPIAKAVVYLPYPIVFPGDSIKFDASESWDTPSDLPNLIYIWDFGDGKTAVGKIVEHAYEKSGIYFVKLTVIDDNGGVDIAIVVVYIAIKAVINFDPDTLNLKSKGKWVTVYIEFPYGYDVSQINISTVVLNDIVYAENNTKYDFVSLPEIKDRDGNGLVEFMVKFDRAMVQDILSPGDNVEIKTIGYLFDGLPFGGKDWIRVID
ncbi:MAG: PQQ-binding-like beta-propeller repeat protein [Candidatus Thermoplasmatota archaeon]